MDRDAKNDCESLPLLNVEGSSLSTTQLCGKDRGCLCIDWERAVMPPARKSEPQLRLDAIAWAWVVAWITVSICLLTYRPFIGISNQLGPAFDDLARWLFDALGLGLLPAMAGGLTLILLYVQRREWAVVAVRLGGWLLLALASAALADLAFGLKAGRISVYGMGGSIGAWLRFLISSQFKVPVPALILSATACIGLILVADRLLHLLGRMLNRLVVAIVDWATRTNHRITLISNQIVEAISARWQRFPRTDAPQPRSDSPRSIDADHPSTTDAHVDFASQTAAGDQHYDGSIAVANAPAVAFTIGG